MQQRSIGLSILFFAANSCVIAASLTTLCANEIDRFAVLGIRQLIVAFAMLKFYTLTSNYRALYFPTGRQGLLFLLAFAGQFICALAYVLSLTFGSVITPLILFYVSAPIWRALLGNIFLHEVISRMRLLVLSIAFPIAVLIYFMSDDWGRPDTFGISLSLTASFGWSVANLAQDLQKRTDGPAPGQCIHLQALTWSYFCVASVGLIFGQGELPTESNALALLVTAGLTQGVGMLAYNLGARKVRTIESVIIFSTLEPILSPIWAIALVGETPGVAKLVGAFLMLACVVVPTIVEMRRMDDSAGDD